MYEVITRNGVWKKGDDEHGVRHLLTTSHHHDFPLSKHLAKERERNWSEEKRFDGKSGWLKGEERKRHDSETDWIDGKVRERRGPEPPTITHHQLYLMSFERKMNKEENRQDRKNKKVDGPLLTWINDRLPNHSLAIIIITTTRTGDKVALIIIASSGLKRGRPQTLPPTVLTLFKCKGERHRDHCPHIHFKTSIRREEIE